MRLTCLNPPIDRFSNGATEFGLQDKKQALAPGVENIDGKVHYDLTIEATRSDGSPSVRFRGPYVHGTPSAPFLYLSLRQIGAASNEWIKRVKVPLTGIDWTMVEDTSEPVSDYLAATVSGHRSGTVPLLEGGWQRVKNLIE